MLNNYLSAQSNCFTLILEEATQFKHFILFSAFSRKKWTKVDLSGVLRFS